MTTPSRTPSPRSGTPASLPTITRIQARTRALQNNASMTGNLQYLKNGSNIPFRVGSKPNGEPIYRSEDSHTLARWFMKASTHPFTREQVSVAEKKRVFRKALESKNKGNHTFTADEIKWMRNFVTGNRQPNTGGRRPPTISRGQQRSARRRGTTSVRRNLSRMFA